MNYLYRIAFLAFLCGALLFAYRNSWIIIRSPWQNSTSQHIIGADKKKVIIFHHTSHGFVAEPQQMVWHADHIPLNASRLVNAYLTIVYEENLLDKKIQLHGATTTSTNQELSLNFSHALFPEEAPIHEKWMLLEGLLKTIREQLPTIKTVRFLVNHKPLMDHHLDFSRAWPIEGFLSTQAASTPAHHSEAIKQEPYTIMLEPAGDAQYTGRIIGDAFERGITLQCAQELKKILETTCKHTRIILSRFPGEVLEPLQNAAFANRLKTDLYITIGIYQLPATAHTTDRPAEINMYHFLYHPTTDFWQRTNGELACEPYHQAHIPYTTKSQSIAHTLFKNLQSIKPFAGTLNQCGGLPIKPLIGIAAPALMIELGLPHKESWQLLATQLAQQISQIVTAQH